MNRQQRRQAARAGRRQDHQGCGCQQRWLVPLEEPACPGCGAVSALVPAQGLPWLTGAPAGSVMGIEVGCGCGASYEVQVGVE